MISDCVETSAGDIRSAINAMQMLCSNQHSIEKQQILPASHFLEAPVNGTKAVKNTSKVDKNKGE